MPTSFEPFSTAAYEFVVALSDTLKRYRPQETGSLLLDLRDVTLSGSKDTYYRMLYRHLAADLLFKIDPETIQEVAKFYWDIPEGQRRNTPVCCRSSSVSRLAHNAVSAMAKRWPDDTPVYLEDVFKKMMTLEAKDFRLFTPLGRSLIQEVKPLVPLTKELVTAYDLVRGRNPPLQPPSEPEPAVVEDPLDLTDEDVEELLNSDKEFPKIPRERVGDYLALTEGAFLEKYGDVYERPYMGILYHEHLSMWLLVMCSKSGLNEEGLNVYAGGKYGSGGTSEVNHRDWESVIGDLWVPTQQGEPKMLIKALPYVEGGYGKYWINVEGMPKGQGDVLKAFFVTENHCLRIVSEKEYFRQRSIARREPDLSPDPSKSPKGFFNVKAPRQSEALRAD